MNARTDKGNVMVLLRVWDVDEGENATVGYVEVPVEALAGIQAECLDLDLRVEVLDVTKLNSVGAFLAWQGGGVDVEATTEPPPSPLRNEYNREDEPRNR